MSFFNVVMFAVIVLVIQAALIMGMVYVAGRQIRKEQIRLQNERMDALYSKAIRLVFKFKREWSDMKEMWPQ